MILALALRNLAISEGFIFLTLNGKAVFDKSANLLCLLFGNLTTAKHHAVEEIAQTAYKMDTTAHLFLQSSTSLKWSEYHERLRLPRNSPL